MKITLRTNRIKIPSRPKEVICKKSHSLRYKFFKLLYALTFQFAHPKTVRTNCMRKIKLHTHSNFFFNLEKWHLTVSEVERNVWRVEFTSFEIWQFFFKTNFSGRQITSAKGQEIICVALQEITVAHDASCDKMWQCVAGYQGMAIISNTWQWYYNTHTFMMSTATLN